MPKISTFRRKWQNCIRTVKPAPDYAHFVIGNGSKLAIFNSYKICKQCKWTYSNLHSSFNIRVNSLGFFDEIKRRESPRIAHSLA